MTQNSPTTTSPWWMRLHERLRDRCTRLGLPTWCFDEHGKIVSDFATAGESFAPLTQWLGSAKMRERVQKAVKANLDGDTSAAAFSDDSAMVRLFRGCSLIILHHQEGSRIVGATAVLVLHGEVLHCPEFAAMAKAAGLTGTAARPASALVRPSESDANQLHEILRWAAADLAKLERDHHTLNQFGEKLVQAYEETNMLFRFARSLNCVNDPQQLMSLICQQLQQTLPLRWVAVRFAEQPPQGADGKIVPDLVGKLILAGETPCPQADLDVEVGRILEDWRDQDWTRLLEPSQHPLARLVNAEVIAEQITHDGTVIGVLLAGNRMGDETELCSAEMQFVDAAADFLGVFHENLARFAEQRLLFKGTVKALSAAIDAKDRYTCGHSERVALLATLMATASGFSKEQIEQYQITGLVHDVGKIGVPESVLCKPARLSEAEFEIIKGHPRIGHDILKDVPMLAAMLPGVLHHHERWDGSGYPSGLKGSEIPHVARVLAMADAFDAMSSNRSYRPALTRDQVFEEIRQCAGTQFDPQVAELFLTLDFAPFDALLARFHNRQRAAA